MIELLQLNSSISKKKKSFNDFKKHKINKPKQLTNFRQF